MYFKKTVLSVLLCIMPCFAAKKEKNESFLRRNKGKIVLALSGGVTATACCGALLYKCCDIAGWMRNILERMSFNWPTIEINTPRAGAAAADSAASVDEEKKDDEDLEKQRVEREPRTEFE